MIMNPVKRNIIAAVICSSIFYTSCKVPSLVATPSQKTPPSSYTNSLDTVNSGNIQWRKFFTDKYLVNLIDTALQNNQELLTTLQEIEIARGEGTAALNFLPKFVVCQPGAAV